MILIKIIASIIKGEKIIVHCMQQAALSESIVYVPAEFSLLLLTKSGVTATDFLTMTNENISMLSPLINYSQFLPQLPFAGHHEQKRLPSAMGQLPSPLESTAPPVRVC